MTDQTTFATDLQRKIDMKTKPPGSLGRIEELAAQLASIQSSLMPRMETCQLTIFAADHGIAASGVSAFPQEVTRQMVLNFLNHYEVIAMGISDGILDEQVYKNYMRSIVVRDWFAAEPFGAGPFGAEYSPPEQESDPVWADE